jgi:AP-4 complex subunit beta-1
VDTLLEMILDKDVNVVINCITALNEILENKNGLKVTKKMVHYLLNRLREYSEWQICTVLNLLLKYTPQDANEIFDIMVKKESFNFF